MPKKARNVAQAIRLVSMDGVEVGRKRFLKGFTPHPVEFAEPFSNKTVETGVGTLLRTTLDDHVAEFDLLAFLNVDLHQLVHCFLVTQSVHDREVNGAT